jgi:hypothetical protein
MEFWPLTADACQRELCLSLGEPHGWSIGPERRTPYSHSRYLHKLAADLWLHSPSGSPMPDHARHAKCSW